MTAKYTIGLDYGTNSVRGVLVDISNGRQLATSVCEYPSGTKGVVLDDRHPLLARHNPRDYVKGFESVIVTMLEMARIEHGISAGDIIGIGVDATGSTPIPVDGEGEPLAFQDAFADNPDAFAWLWKDHTSIAEAEEITEKARTTRPAYLGKVGGSYSSEWFWSKLLRCRRASPELFAAAWSWVEMCDWIPALLSGETKPERIRRGVCAAGHKAFYHPDWGGWPDHDFLASLDPELARIASTFGKKAFTIGDRAGTLCREWADRLGLKEGIAIAAGAFDAHLGGVGAGIAPNVLVRNIGTSTCDMMVSVLDQALPDIPGLAGVVPESILPGYYGLEAGQSAVGDIFNWFTSVILDGCAGSSPQPRKGHHERLQEEAMHIPPGASGLLSLDWHNGNRTILMDQRLTGAILGLTLHSTQAEIYAALVEGTAFGARMIAERFEEAGCRIDRVINCGGIAQKSPVVMQIYADVLGKTMEVSKSSQTAALGCAIAASVVAGADAGGHESFAQAVQAMTAVSDTVYRPDPARAAVYSRLFELYRMAHDAFGKKGTVLDLSGLMKSLIAIRDEARKI